MINKENLMNCLSKATKIILVLPTEGEFPDHKFLELELNDFVLTIDGTLQLWHNPSNYEI